MEPRPPRWRFRISTLMQLVVIAALSIAMVIEHRNHERELQLVRAKTKADLAESRRHLARLQTALQASNQALERAKQAHAAAEAVPKKTEKARDTPDESPRRTEA